MKHLGLFAGIGGFELAARWMNWETIAWCEINPFCQQVLKHHFPDATPHSDITTTDFTIYRGMVDILTGGFPCQPYSTAGKRLGKADDRHLWPHMLRAIREVRPRWVVGENVRGLTNWNGGLVFDEVQADLEAEGYEVIPFLLPACAVDAPHRRDRIWFVAHAGRGFGRRRQDQQGGHVDNGADAGREEAAGKHQRFYSEGGNPNSNSSGLAKRIQIWRSGTSAPDGAQPGCESKRIHTAPEWRSFPTQSPVCNGDDGLSARLDRLAFSRWRNASIQGGGNAVVPQLPYMIYQAIEQYEAL